LDPRFPDVRDRVLHQKRARIALNQGLAPIVVVRSAVAARISLEIRALAIVANDKSF
jgi:hypothetical protein